MPTTPLLSQLEPTIEAAYQSHMATPRGSREPIYPPSVLARAAGSRTDGGEPDRDPITHGPILP